jgi:hypothetical protein
VNSTWKIKALHAFTGEVTCWNCGKPGHNLRSCPKPRNQNHIDKARTATHENRKSDANNKVAPKEVDSHVKFGKPPAHGETVQFAKQESGKKVGAQLKPKKFKSKKSKSDADTGGGLTLAALGEHFAKMATSALDPTQANMAQLLKNLFQGKV